MTTVSLLAESWTWYAFAILTAVVRYVSRYIQLGSLRAFQTEDYAMLVTLVFYTVLITCMNIVSSLNTNLMLPGEELTLTPESIESRIRGSKYVLVVEQSMLVTIWSCKACLLLMYNKLTFGLKQHLAVKIVAGYVVFTFVVMEILYLGVWCRPISHYWKVPVDNVQCSAATNHLITNTVFNISSDIMMLCIPLPLLLKSQLMRAKKLILCGLFGLGIFVMLCAGLSKYYSFTAPFSPMWTFWYVREASTAVLVANIPNCWPLIRRIFKLRSFIGSSSFNSRTPTYGNQSTSMRKPGTAVRLSSLPRSNRNAERGGQVSWWERERTGSEEEIVEQPKQAKLMPLEIWESKAFYVDRGSKVKGHTASASTVTLEKRSDSSVSR